MSYSVVIDWRFIVALGASTASIIFLSKIDSADAKEVAIHVIDTFKGTTIALNGD